MGNSWSALYALSTVFRSVGELQMVANNYVISGSACIQSCNVCIDIECFHVYECMSGLIESVDVNYHFCTSSVL